MNAPIHAPHPAPEQPLTGSQAGSSASSPNAAKAQAAPGSHAASV